VLWADNIRKHLLCSCCKQLTSYKDLASFGVGVQVLQDQQHFYLVMETCAGKLWH
jgi:hypothetical protein